MKVYADYHTHTIYSHGKGTIEDNVKAALKKGLKEIAISDHGAGHLGFGVRRSKLKEMRQEIDRLQDKYPAIKILLGVEANVLGLDGSTDIGPVEKTYCDIILCGYHFGARPGNLFRDFKLHWANIFKQEDLARRLNTKAIINAIKRNPIDIISHPGAKGPVDIVAIAKVAQEAGTALEINNSHGYLNLDQLIALKETEVDFVIGSDAHHPDRVGSFDLALDRVKKAGIPLSRIRNVEVSDED